MPFRDAGRDDAHGRVSSRPMCEQFVARAAEPFRIDDLWPFTERLERYGLAGFGWGASWLRADRRLCSHRELRAFRDDTDGAGNIGREETTAVLVHLRRPSRLSTLQLPDAQPFDDPAGRFSFSHNGDLREWRAARPRYQAQERIHGRADTEVGQRWLEDAWTDGGSAPQRLRELHEAFGGQANLAVLGSDGTLVHYAGNTDNPVFTFRLGRIGIASTGLYSLDRSLFTYAARGATRRRLVRVGDVVILDRHGSPLLAS
jgi:Glutamine amidotransferase domain